MKKQSKNGAVKQAAKSSTKEPADTLRVLLQYEPHEHGEQLLRDGAGQFYIAKSEDGDQRPVSVQEALAWYAKVEPDKTESEGSIVELIEAALAKPIAPKAKPGKPLKLHRVYWWSGPDGESELFRDTTGQFYLKALGTAEKKPCTIAEGLL